MSAKSRIWGACKALAVRSRPLPIRTEPLVCARPARRLFADDATTRPTDGLTRPEPTQSAPAGKDASVQAENSTEKLTRDAATKGTDASQSSVVNTLDDATLEQIFYGGRIAAGEGDKGLTLAQEEVLYQEGMIPPVAEADAVLAATKELSKPGLKFGQPTGPFPHVKKRYHPVLEQITRILMRDGKLSVAQRNMAMVMNYLRTAPAPIYSPSFPLLPGTPPASHLPLNPVLYITIAIDSVAPLVKIRGIAGAAGGGRALEVPVPLAVRQRRRTAFKWILEAVTKKPSTGSGRKQLPHRIAEEIIAVVEGRSGVWERRKLVHKAGTAARANITTGKARAWKKK